MMTNIDKCCIFSLKSIIISTFSIFFILSYAQCSLLCVNLNITLISPYPGLSRGMALFSLSSLYTLKPRRHVVGKANIHRRDRFLHLDIH